MNPQWGGNFSRWESVFRSRTDWRFVGMSADVAVVLPQFPHLVDADFGLHILQPFLQDGDERCRGHQSSVDVGLADVALDAKGKRRVGETFKRKAPFRSH